MTNINLLATDKADDLVAPVNQTRKRKSLRRRVQWTRYRHLRSRTAHRWIRQFGWDRPLVEPTFSSTHQAVPLNPFVVHTHPAWLGPIFGRDVVTGAVLSGSPQRLYERGLITAPIILILGAIGTRKSTTSKTLYGLRALATGTRVAVFDRKIQREGETLSGEYHRLAKVVPDSQVVVLDRNRSVGTRINILDPTISATTTEALVGQDELLRMVATSAMGRLLTPEEAYALSAAHRAAITTAASADRDPVLADVIKALYTPDEAAVPGPSVSGEKSLTVAGVVDRNRVTEWGLSVGLALERFIEGDLSGLIDGPTEGPNGEPVELLAPLLVIDTSALTEGSEALDLMMAIVSTYLMARWSKVRGFKILTLEEAYSADQLGSVSKVIRALVKRSRGVGAAVMAVVHHLSDVPTESPLYSLIKESGIAHIFAQDKTEDAEQVIRQFNLPEEIAEVIQTLPPGRHVWWRGARLPAVFAEGFRTTLEAWVTDTDEAMKSGEQ